VTTNPLLTRKSVAGKSALKELVRFSAPYPVSVQVHSRGADGMTEEAKSLSDLGDNTVVKIPVVAPDGTPNLETVHKVSELGIPVNATACMTVGQALLAAYAGARYVSLLAGLVGEQVASELVTIVDDGRLDDGPSTAPFDDEGVPTSRTPLIERGVLRGFLHNTETARRDNAGSTGNASRPSYRGVPGVAPTNLLVEGGSENADAILERAGRAVYIQDVSGVHSGANPVSGEFSVGATGLRVESGSLGEPLREITIASTLPEVLRRVEAVGSDVRFFPGAGAIGTPTILVSEMTVAGT
jgi:PmbA protein